MYTTFNDSDCHSQPQPDLHPRLLSSRTHPGVPRPPRSAQRLWKPCQTNAPGSEAARSACTQHSLRAALLVQRAAVQRSGACQPAARSPPGAPHPAAMRVRGSVRRLCEYCFVVRRRGKVRAGWGGRAACTPACGAPSVQCRRAHACTPIGHNWAPHQLPINARHTATAVCHVHQKPKGGARACSQLQGSVLQTCTVPQASHCLHCMPPASSTLTRTLPLTTCNPRSTSSGSGIQPAPRPS